MSTSSFELGTEPKRSVAVFERHSEAEELVGQLADRGFPVERLTIVGRDPHVVEQVTGPFDAWRALLAGAASGAFVGAVFGLLFGALFSPDGVSMLAIVLYWLAVSTGFGALFGIVGYAFNERRFTSESGIVAERYEVMADAEVADDALKQLSRLDAIDVDTTETTKSSR